jgi:dephospho-CoA kinase
MLAARGAIVFDADDLARLAIAPGTPGHDRVVERFGTEVLTPEGAVDRRALAEIVFADPRARTDLESIVHPEVFRLLAEGLDEYRESDRIVVFDAPLIMETGFDEACDVVVVVSAPAEAQVARMARDRAMPEADTRSRIAAQMPLEAKTRSADVVLDNGGTLQDLEAQIHRLWEDLLARARKIEGR